MPVAKIHVLECRYDERRLGNVSKAVQDARIGNAACHAAEYCP